MRVSPSASPGTCSTLVRYSRERVAINGRRAPVSTHLRHDVGAAEDVLTGDNLRELYGFPLVPVEIGGERLFLPERQSAEGPHV